jgi:hypothetical protein
METHCALRTDSNVLPLGKPIGEYCIEKEWLVFVKMAANINKVKIFRIA